MGIGRGVRALLSGGFVCALVLGCTAQKSPPDRIEPSPDAGTTAPRPATITFDVFGPKDSLDSYDALASAFEQANPHITVKVRRVADVDSAMAAVASHQPPDVFLMDHARLPQLLRDELVQPVDALLEAREVDFGDGYQRGGLTAFAADDALQCMPHDVSPRVVYYNQDLVNLDRLGTEEEQPPNAVDGWTWETFTAAARQAARGPASGVYIEPSLQSLAPFVWSAGGEIVDDPQAPTTLTLSDRDAREALEQVLALARDPQVTPSLRELQKRDAVERFADGELGMILGTRALTPRFRAAEGLRFDVMPLPSLGRLRTVADMTGYCIFAGTAQLEAAGDFLAFAVGREGATLTARDGYVVPSNLEVANSPVFVQQTSQPASSFVFNEGVRRTQSLPFTPAWPELVAQVQPALRRMFHAPVIDLEALLEEIDARSVSTLAPAVQ